MKVKTFCSRCANWYKIIIKNFDGEILYKGTALETCYSIYSNKIVKEFIIEAFEGFNDEAITICI